MKMIHNNSKFEHLLILWQQERIIVNWSHQFHCKRKQCLKHLGTFSQSQPVIEVNHLKMTSLPYGVVKPETENWLCFFSRSSYVPLRGTFPPLPHVYSEIIPWRGNWRVSKPANSLGCQLIYCRLSKARSPLRNSGRRRVQSEWQLSTRGARAWKSTLSFATRSRVTFHSRNFQMQSLLPG